MRYMVPRSRMAMIRTGYPPPAREIVPLLCQSDRSGEDSRMSGGLIRRALGEVLTFFGRTDSTGEPLDFPHDFRRLFISDAVCSGLPPHIAQAIAGHANVNTTMGYGLGAALSLRGGTKVACVPFLAGVRFLQGPSPWLRTIGQRPWKLMCSWTSGDSRERISGQLGFPLAVSWRGSHMAENVTAGHPGSFVWISGTLIWACRWLTPSGRGSSRYFRTGRRRGVAVGGITVR